MQIVVDLDDGGGATGGDAFDMGHRKFAIGSHFIEGDAQFFEKMIASGLTPIQGAGKGPADFDVIFSHGFLPEHGVEGDELENLHGLQFEFGGNPLHRVA